MKNKTIDVIKGISIVSVICAHCNSVPNGSGMFVQYSSLFLSNLGTFGVIVFFILSGILYNPDKFTVRIKKLIVPWIIASTLVYLYVYLRKPPITLTSYISFIIGWNSYFYYLSVLVILMFLFSIHVFSNKYIKYTCIVVTILSVLFFPEKGSIPAKIDITNWVGYFAVGQCIRDDIGLFERMMRRIIKYRYVIYMFLLILLIINVWKGNEGKYYYGMNACVSWLGALSIILFGISLTNNKNTKHFQLIGESSLYVYMYHMPIAGIVANIMNYPGVRVFVLMRPVIVLLLVTLVLIIIKHFDKNNMLCPLIGIRSRR